MIGQHPPAPTVVTDFGACLPISTVLMVRPIPGVSLSAKLVATRACGSSMEDAGILSGDYVISVVTAAPEPGSLIIADTPNGLVVRYLHQRGETIILRSANPCYPDEAWQRGEVTIHGVVKRVERDL